MQTALTLAGEGMVSGRFGERSAAAVKVRRLRASVLAAFAWLVPAVAWAKPSAEEPAVARQLYEKAVAAQESNDWAQCEEAVTEALGIIETPGLRFHQAYCKEQQSKWIEALVDYKRAEELIAGGVEASDVEPLLKPAIGRLEAKVPRLTVNVDNEPGQVSFYLDGKERSAKLLGKGVQLNPGPHTVEVSAPGYDSATRSVSLKEGERSSISLRLESNGEPVAANTAGAGEVGDSDLGLSRRGGGSKVSAKPFVLAGEGLVVAGLTGLGIYFLVDAERDDNARGQFAATVPTGTCDGNNFEQNRVTCQSLKDWLDRVKERRTYGYYSFAGAGAAAAVLITTWLAWDDSPKVIVGVEREFTGVTVSGTF